MRCFVAIELPAAIRERLASLQCQLQDLDRCLRWTRAEQIHLTLKFLGEVPESQIAEVCSAVRTTAAAFSPMRLEVAGAGCFPPHGAARVVWAGIVAPPPELSECQMAMEQAFAELGYPPEERAFRPHLTIGRSRDPRGAREVRAALEAVRDYSAGTFTARELVMFQSVLSKTGPTYTVLGRAPFTAPQIVP